MALLCCWSTAACAADAWCTALSKPAYSFEWVANSEVEDNTGSVRVKDASGKTVQVLANLENYYGSSDGLDARRDFNNDGCPDLVVTHSKAGIGNESARVFLYSRSRQRFEANEALSNIGGLDLDPRDRNCVTGSWKGGAQDINWEQHCWNKGKLVLMREGSVSPMYDEEGTFQCYEHVETTYRNGKKHTRTDCTQEF